MTIARLDSEWYRFLTSVSSFQLVTRILDTPKLQRFQRLLRAPVRVVAQAVEVDWWSGGFRVQLGWF